MKSENQPIVWGRAGVRITASGTALQLTEICVILPSIEADATASPDNRYVAYGIETGLVALGSSSVEAYSNLLSSLIVLFDHWRRRSSTIVYRRAPADIVRKYTRCSRLSENDQEKAIRCATERTQGICEWQQYGWTAVPVGPQAEPPLPCDLVVSKDDLLDDTGTNYYKQQLGMCA